MTTTYESLKIDRPIAWVLAGLLGLCGSAHADSSHTGSKPRVGASPSHPEVEGLRSKAQDDAQSRVDAEATAAIAETQHALEAVGHKDKKEALAALERATGKVNILLARNDKAALIPVDFAVEIADTAPQDTKAINNIAEQSRDALKGRHFAEARALLDALRSEVRIRTFNLPLATYPGALLRAAKLVEDGKNDDAARVLTIALDTLLIVDRAISIPLVEVTDQLRAADDDVKKKKNAEVGKALAAASTALQRAQALGHVDDKAAKDFQKQIDDLDRKVKGNEGTGALFSRLRNSVSSVFKKQSETSTGVRGGKVP